MRKTKIICTLGPAVDSVEGISGLLERGMNGARFNFSHGTHESHLKTLRYLEEAMERTGIPAAKILDTKGPEIRIKTFEEHEISLKKGDSFTLCTRDVPGTAERVSVTYENLAEELSVGNVILLDDGLIRMEIESIANGNIYCKVLTGGHLSDNKSINIPGSNIRLPSLTEKDRLDLAFAVKYDFDYIAASFIRSAADVRELRSTLDALGGHDIRIISKIENQQGVDNLEEIILASDGVMVARGDMGVEIPAAKVPAVQKRMIASCRAAGKLVVVATQMLDSMIHNPSPTRAEVSDVANAVYDMACCVMLSGETASGSYPMESLDAMRQIAEETESVIHYWSRFEAIKGTNELRSSVSDAIAHTCCVTAMDLHAKAIVTATQTGYTAQNVARFRPMCDILALTPSEKTVRQLQLVWGAQARKCTPAVFTDDIIRMCADAAHELPGVNSGDTVVLVAGVPLGVSGNTNLIKAQLIR